MEIRVSGTRYVKRTLFVPSSTVVGNDYSISFKGRSFSLLRSQSCPCKPFLIKKKWHNASPLTTDVSPSLNVYLPAVVDWR